MRKKEGRKAGGNGEEEISGWWKRKCNRGKKRREEKKESEKKNGICYELNPCQDLKSKGWFTIYCTRRVVTGSHYFFNGLGRSSTQE